MLFSCATQLLLSQENDGVVSFDVPVRNSLMFNRYTINPTFSFVREQHKFASIYNKREWVQFNDAPLTYLASYSGRFAENIGAGVGLFQQNYGVLTTFGGILNFAYNARIDRDNNLTFGLNIGAYSSGINTNNTTTNFADPSLQNVPSNFLLTVNPGINYGTTFLDFGVAVNNLFVYNLENSSMLKDDPNQGIQAHVMYTGYMSSRGFFDDSRFSGLLRSEFTEDETIISANAMVYVPKGLWFQGGYNSLYGASGGVGINITKEIAIEYNFETAFGDFGPSHEVTLAYRFKNERYFDYSRQDEVSGLISTDKKPRRRVVASRKPERKIVPAVKTKNPEAEALLKLDQENAQLEAERLAKEKAEAERLKEAQEEAARLAKIEEERLAEQKRIARAKIEADKRAKALEEQKQRQEAERLAKLERERIAEQKRIADEKLAAERRAKELEAQKEQEETDRLAKIESERLAKEKADEEAIKLEAERLAKEKAENELIANPKDEFGRAMLSLTKDAEDDKTKQSDLLEQYNKAVEGKNENLKNLKEENDLGDQGIVVKPKAFKSVTKENDRLRAIKTELDDVILKRNQKIKELEELYDDMYEADTIVNELVMLYYKKEIAELKKEQRNANDIKLDLENKLEQIQIGIEFEKRRRIKRAEYDNEEERYAQDRATLKNLKASTDIGTANLEPEDFDFGIEQSNNITILKNVNYTESGYYMVLAVHTDTEKRDEFITKAIASGVADIEFFYDVNTSQYFIYQKKFNSVQEANSTIKQRGTKSYNSKMTIIKIEN
ncbi:type IX secretion system membrane protein, PorP/SprF family [Winogradskyella jejuensis]|uniref:Type IX secretion system membrane protein, PorP/SprF family n=1 Tax=Winogradskyella jejuensis TaxID=1089305 RepID=A0A1M5UD49_9FLAO|nr:type IX secretion system membrane protein, PorP/SprF family [Winogradskyella jejuensis]